MCNNTGMPKLFGASFMYVSNGTEATEKSFKYFEIIWNIAKLWNRNGKIPAPKKWSDAENIPYEFVQNFADIDPAKYIKEISNRQWEISSLYCSNNIIKIDISLPSNPKEIGDLVSEIFCMFWNILVRTFPINGGGLEKSFRGYKFSDDQLDDLVNSCIFCEDEQDHAVPWYIIDDNGYIGSFDTDFTGPLPREIACKVDIDTVSTIRNYFCKETEDKCEIVEEHIKYLPRSCFQEKIKMFRKVKTMENIVEQYISNYKLHAQNGLYSFHVSDHDEIAYSLFAKPENPLHISKVPEPYKSILQKPKFEKSVNFKKKNIFVKNEIW